MADDFDAQTLMDLWKQVPDLGALQDEAIKTGDFSKLEEASNHIDRLESVTRQAAEKFNIPVAAPGQEPNKQDAIDNLPGSKPGPMATPPPPSINGLTPPPSAQGTPPVIVQNITAPPQAFNQDQGFKMQDFTRPETQVPTTKYADYQKMNTVVPPPTVAAMPQDQYTKRKMLLTDRATSEAIKAIDKMVASGTYGHLINRDRLVNAVRSTTPDKYASTIQDNTAFQIEDSILGPVSKAGAEYAALTQNPTEGVIQGKLGEQDRPVIQRRIKQLEGTIPSVEETSTAAAEDRKAMTDFLQKQKAEQEARLAGLPPTVVPPPEFDEAGTGIVPPDGGLTPPPGFATPKAEIPEEAPAPEFDEAGTGIVPPGGEEPFVRKSLFESMKTKPADTWAKDFIDMLKEKYGDPYEAKDAVKKSLPKSLQEIFEERVRTELGPKPKQKASVFDIIASFLAGLGRSEAGLKMANQWKDDAIRWDEHRAKIGSEVFGMGKARESQEAMLERSHQMNLERDRSAAALQKQRDESAYNRLTESLGLRKTIAEGQLDLGKDKLAETKRNNDLRNAVAKKQLEIDAVYKRVQMASAQQKAALAPYHEQLQAASKMLSMGMSQKDVDAAIDPILEKMKQIVGQ